MAWQNEDVGKHKVYYRPGLESVVETLKNVWHSEGDYLNGIYAKARTNQDEGHIFRLREDGPEYKIKYTGQSNGQDKYDIEKIRYN